MIKIVLYSCKGGGLPSLPPHVCFSRPVLTAHGDHGDHGDQALHMEMEKTQEFLPEEFFDASESWTLEGGLDAEMILDES